MRRREGKIYYMNIIKNVYQNVEYIYYIDESKANDKYIYTALGVPIKQWNHIFGRIQAFRQYINKQYGIQLYKELHATKFVNGRGQFAKIVSKYQRSEIFKMCLKTIAAEFETGIHTFSSITDTPEKSLERIVTRIGNTARHNDYFALIFFDSGNEVSTQKNVRKMRAINYIPSKYGQWDSGSYTKNIPVERIVADSMFIDSSKDYMIQVADFVAYSVKTKYEPSSNAKKYALEDSYLILEPIILKQATQSNEFGIVDK